MTEPTWLTYARAELGTAEIPGPQTATKIREWLTSLKAWWTDDETPWCGTFVAHVMERSGIELPKNWFRARAWLEWGDPAPDPSLGCVVVFDGGPSRPGAGHVGLVVGRDLHGRLLVLGGNQGNRVSIAPFDEGRVLGYRVPKGRVLLAKLPTFANSDAASRSEA